MNQALIALRWASPMAMSMNSGAWARRSKALRYRDLLEVPYLMRGHSSAMRCQESPNRMSAHYPVPRLDAILPVVKVKCSG